MAAKSHHSYVPNNHPSHSLGAAQRIELTWIFKKFIFDFFICTFFRFLQVRVIFSAFRHVPRLGRLVVRRGRIVQLRGISRRLRNDDVTITIEFDAADDVGKFNFILFCRFRNWTFIEGLVATTTKKKRLLRKVLLHKNDNKLPKKTPPSAPSWRYFAYRQ